MLPRVPLLRVLIFLTLIMLWPASLAAQANTEDDTQSDSFVLQINQPAVVETGHVTDGVVVIDDDVIVDGQVTEFLMVVVNGTATVNGTVTGDIVVFEGQLNLAYTATVDNVTLVRSEMNQANGATITGDVTERSEYISLGFGWTLFSVMFWIGATIAMLLLTLLIVALLGRTLTHSAEMLAARPLESGITGFLAWMALPLLTLFAFITIIGIPIGFGLLLVVLPLLALIGYVVTASWLGHRVARMFSLHTGRYLAVIVGEIILQLLGLVPWIGGIFVFLATIGGTGALLYTLYQERRASRQASAAPVPPTIGGPVHA
jgi:hypothetical protein